MVRRNPVFAGVVLWVVCVSAASAQSLYDPSTYRPLGTDLRARAVGDALTVLIFESATASSSASTSARRSSNLAVSAAEIGEEAVGGDFSSDNQFDGGGQERRTGQLIAQITVTVQSVLPNGDLIVKGEQMISLNNESQRIHIEGRVRPQDVLADNTVLSSRMADSRIDFKGKGLLSSREKPGLIARFLHWLL